MHLQKISVIVGKGYIACAYDFFPLAQVTNPADTAILFGNNEGGTGPACFLVGVQSAEANTMVQFMLESGQVNPRHRIRKCVYCFTIGVDVNVYPAVRIDTKRSIKKFPHYT